MISAKVVADSKNEFGNRITTMAVTMPRIILAEFNTHRMFSRNSASSRAIPFEKMVKSVEENPFIPIAWQKDHKGMQGSEYLINEELKWNWLEARDKAIQIAKTLSDKDVTKQLCNRLLEPFMWHTVIVTTTEWENFFALRCPQYKALLISEEQTYRSKKDWLNAYPHLKETAPKDYLSWADLNKGQAEIHMMALAEAMWDAFNESQPKELKAGEWHIPFGDNIEMFDKNDPDNKGLYWAIKYTEPLHRYTLPDLLAEREIEYKIKIATARCARVSYTVVGEGDKKDNYENDIKLHDRLLESKHMSPFEHCAQAMGDEMSEYHNSGWWSGNFKGFHQYRKTFNNENIQ